MSTTTTTSAAAAAAAVVILQKDIPTAKVVESASDNRYIGDVEPRPRRLFVLS